MEILQKNRTSLFNLFSKQFSIFESSLKEELLRRDNDYALEREAFRQEIAALRHGILKSKDSGTEDTNLHNVKTPSPCLLSESSSAEIQDKHRLAQTFKDCSNDELLGSSSDFSNNPDSSKPKHDELERLQALLNDSQTEYQKLSEAHIILLQKYRESRDLIKKWNKFNEQQEKPQRNRTITPQAPNCCHIAEDKSRSLGSKDLSRPPSPTSFTASRPTFDLREIAVNRKPGSQQENTTSSFHVSEQADFKEVAPSIGLPGLLPTNPTNESDTSHSGADLPISVPRTSKQNDPGTNLQSPKPVDVDSDLPIFVSERSLKRKKQIDSPRKKSMAVENSTTVKGSVSRPVHIKSEPCSSSPLASTVSHTLLFPHESIDLDDVENNRATPRKRQRLWTQNATNLIEPISPSGTKLNEGSLMIPQSNKGVDTCMDGSIARGQQKHQSTRLGVKELRSPKTDLKIQRLQTLNRKTHRKRDMQIQPFEKSSEGHINQIAPGFQSSTIINQLFQADESHLIAPEECRANERLNSHKFPIKHSGTHINELQALRPLDSNTHILPRSSKETAYQKSDAFSTRPRCIASEISTVAEDGEDLMIAAKSEVPAANLDMRHPDKSVNVSKMPKASDLHQRLDKMLVGPCNDESTVPLQGHSVKSSNESKMLKSSPFTDRSCAAYASSVSPVDTWHIPTTKDPARAEALPKQPVLSDGSGKALSRHKALRLRPLRDLRPSDFKINASCNHGIHYAFKDVVRNKELRKCMPGCTRSGCCGAVLRKVVEMGGYKSSSVLEPAALISNGEAKEDQSLLEDYLGDDIHRLKGMPEEERKELVVQAKTEKFANQYGKHRHVYSRALTPPGYWDTDMPTTQQEEKYRRAARELERQRVEEMYREAMRPGGRYRFRDE